MYIREKQRTERVAVVVTRLFGVNEIIGVNYRSNRDRCAVLRFAQVRSVVRYALHNEWYDRRRRVPAYKMYVLLLLLLHYTSRDCCYIGACCVVRGYDVANPFREPNLGVANMIRLFRRSRSIIIIIITIITLLYAVNSMRTRPCVQTVCMYIFYIVFTLLSNRFRVR